jgi:Zn-dependent protease
MNVILALFGAVLGGLFARYFQSGFSNEVQMLSVDLIILNASLLVFNALPLPPLDGTRIVRHLIGLSDAAFNRLADHSWWILLLLLNLRPFQKILAIVIQWVIHPFLLLANAIAG